MKNIYKKIIAISIVTLFAPLLVMGSSIIFPYGGGTGTSTSPTYGQLLVGNSSGTYTLTATSTLGIVSGGSFSWTPTSWGVSTSTTIGLLNGFISTASSTITDVANLHIPGGSNGQVLSTNGSGTLSWATASGGSSSAFGGYSVLATSTSMTIDICDTAFATSSTNVLKKASSNIAVTVTATNACLGKFIYIDDVAPPTGVIGTTTFSGVYWNGQINPGSAVINGLTDKFMFTVTASTTQYIQAKLDSTY